MLRSILVGLDESASGRAAVGLGVRWAKEFGAVCGGLAAIDESAFQSYEPVPIGGGHFKRHLDEFRLADARKRAAAAAADFAARCHQAGVPAEPAERVGVPADLLTQEAQRYDLLLLGQKADFRFDGCNQPDGTVPAVLHRPPRPVVVVPDGVRDGGTVVVAYDGSLEAARAVAAFEAAGIGARYPTTVVAVSDDPEAAGLATGRAVDYLRRHKVQATGAVLPATADPGGLLLDYLGTCDAHLLVMGAFGPTTWRDFFFGSTTKVVLEGARVPVFLYH